MKPNPNLAQLILFLCLSSVMMAQHPLDQPRVTGVLQIPEEPQLSEERTMIRHLSVSSTLHDRFIEPTSPILGPELAQFIKSHQGHPETIIKDIRKRFPNFQEEIVASSIAYFNTMIPGLIEYDDAMRTSTKPDEGQTWTEVEVASIPLEVLMPLHENYRQNLTLAVDFVDDLGYRGSKDSAIQVAVEYGNRKLTCSTVPRALRPGNIYTKVLPSKMARLVQLNAEISSAEAAYPRLQHSINGYLQHTYNYLLKHDDLHGLLKTTYDAQAEWLAAADSGRIELPFLAHVEKRIVEQGYSHRDALLVLCYSSRNMPSLDMQYSMNPDKTLWLEVFFWKLKPLQNQALDQHFEDVFPNHVFKENPMLYHFATASYLAYEVERAGYRNFTAVGMAFLSKAGYKFHKFLSALDLRRVGKDRYVLQLLQRQSSFSGIQAGYFGGVHGVDMARMEDRGNSKTLRDFQVDSLRWIRAQ